MFILSYQLLGSFVRLQKIINTNTFPRPAFSGPEHVGKADLTAREFYWYMKQSNCDLPGAPQLIEVE